ncbi:MAG: hypothetical protein ACI8TQ_000605 [Planctomycetota bacterium]|jgi:hypothetical protein
MRVLRTLLLPLIVGLAFQSCDVALPKGMAPTAGIPIALQGEWDQIQLAQSNTLYQGERRITFTVELSTGEPIQSKYIERVSCDGAGNFNLLPLYAETPVYPDEATFLELQERREGFYFRYRDFRIRDLTTFLENFRNLDAGSAQTFLGRSAWRVIFVRDTPGGRHYVVTFDVDTGLVLQYDEYDKMGTLVAGLEYTSLDMAPDLSGVAFFIPGNNEQAIDLATDDAQQILGFKPRFPEALPAGFTLMETASVTDTFGNIWIKASYTDGVEMLFFLHRERNAGFFQLPTSSSSRSGVSRDEVILFKAGTVLAAQGTVDGHDMIAVGEVPEAHLLGMINSAL